jgi:hypothetical protein
VSSGCRVFRRLHRELRFLASEFRSHFCATFVSFGGRWTGDLGRMLGSIDRDLVMSLVTDFPAYADLVRQQSDQARAHRFELLGSGPVVVSHGIECRGLEGHRFDRCPAVRIDSVGDWLDGRINRANLDDARRIWRLVDQGYTPIDWQLDFKSGYRWAENVWHRRIRFAHLPGVDVKVPWELARMQHLPTLALASRFAGEGIPGFASSETYLREVRNQVLDFTATNPPGYGVNWACTMDVAIRATNMIVARNIVVASGDSFDEEFDHVFLAGMVAHGRHVVANLEWAPDHRGNHYLANVVGLLAIAAHLPSGDEFDAWLAFAAQELLAEAGYQYHEDGSNFEASVCYHRLSTEMLLWGFAILASLTPEKTAVLRHPQRHRTLPRLRAEEFPPYPMPGRNGESPVPDWCWSRLTRMADFTKAMTRPDGLVVQFGDNDSGRFIVLGSGEQLRAEGMPESVGWSLDHGALTAGIAALTGCALSTCREMEDPGARILQAVVGRDRVPIATAPLADDNLSASVGGNDLWNGYLARFEATAPTSRWTCIFAASSGGLLDRVKLSAFRGMGCYVARSPRLYLAIRCGEIGLSGLGAHAHCDQLAIELVVDGEDRVRDPGTFVYTPLPEVRNAYRSAKAHHVPRVPGCEPADLTKGLFDLRGAAEGECLYFGPRGFIGRHNGYGEWVYRLIKLEPDRVTVCDFADGALSIADPTPEPLAFSPGYGRTLP